MLVLIGMGSLDLAAAPQVAAAPAVRDPAVGPNTSFDLAHRHDALHFTPSTTAIIPRRTTRTAGSAAAPAGTYSAPVPASTIGNGGALRREVLGFAPYWELSHQGNWNYSLLSTVAYFGLDLKTNGSVDQTTPGYTYWNSADLTTIINNAHQAGDRVVVVIKGDSQTGCDTACDVDALVGTEASRQAAISNTINAIAQKSLDGVNVDLEGTSTNYPNVQTNFTTFVRELSTAVHSRWPSAYVTVDTYSGSASWDGGIFKIGDLAPLVDGLFVMGYDMYAANMNTNQAGPNAPLSGPWTYTDATAVNQYLTKAPASKVILGVPYYGYKWSTGGTANSGPPPPYSSTLPGRTPDYYADILSDFGCALNLSKNWDNNASSPWATWWSPGSGDPCGGNHNSWRELYYDNAQSLGLKYDLVNSSGLAGTGMWALGFDGSSSDLWNVLAAKFTGAPSTFYFAEGFTGAGFTETLDLLSAGMSGVAQIDYYTEQGHLAPYGVYLTAGKVTPVSVNAYVGANHNVSAVVHLPAPGVAERVMHFAGSWHGSTAIVGATNLASEWDFAEGSTLWPFNEYLTLQNPSATPAPVTLNYFTDAGPHPTRTLTLPPNTRTTVQVFTGNAGVANASCSISGGTAVNCGVGRSFQGVSAQVLSPTVPIVVERPMYVNGFSFGDGPIKDGHVAFGANGAQTTWNFAEGTTLSGFKEYLTLQNPGAADATVTLKYIDTVGNSTTKTVTVPAQSRFTVQVFDPTNGVGPGAPGISTQVTSTVPIIAERPMYIYHNFGSGIVAGADDVMGATSTASVYEFSNGSTLSGENDYLTIENPNSSLTNLTISYAGPSGRIVRYVTVGANSRHTVEVFKTAEGPGPGVSPMGIVVVADQPVLVEEPTYSSIPSAYGATDTVGYTPPMS